MKKSYRSGRIHYSLIIILGYLLIFSTAAVLYFNPLEKLQILHDTQRKKDLADVQMALERYYRDHGRYPQNPKPGDYRIIGPDGEAILWGENWPAYLQTVPKDPDYPQRTYIYINADGSGQTYYLYASLERGEKDPASCNKGAVCQNVPKGVECGFEQVCNYGVTSSNATP